MQNMSIQEGKRSLVLIDHVLSTAYDILSPTDNRSIQDYLLESIGMSVLSYESTFTSRHREMIERNHITDGALHFTLIQHVCGLAHPNDPVWYSPGDALENHLGSCYRRRRKILQEIVNQPEQFGEMCSSTKVLLVETLTALETKTGRDLSHMKDLVLQEYYQEDLTECELYASLLMHIVPAIYRTAFTHCNKGNLSMYEFCFGSLGIPAKIFKICFTPTEREKILSNVSIDQLETQTIFKLFRHLLEQDGHVWSVLRRLKMKHSQAAQGYFQDQQTYSDAKEDFFSVMEFVEELATGRENKLSLIIKIGESLFSEPSSFVASPLQPSSTSSSILSPSSSVPQKIPSSLPSPLSGIPPSTSSHFPEPSVDPILPSAFPPPSSVSDMNHLPSTTASQSITMFTPSDVNIVRVFVALRRGGPAVKVFARTFEELSPVALADVYEYCKSTLKYTGKQLNTFTNDELSVMQDRTTDLTQLDLTFLYKLLGHVCGLAKLTDWPRQPSNSLECNLFLVKCSRNFLAHEASQYSDSELKQLLLVDLPKRLETILHKLEEICRTKSGHQINLSQMIADVNEELKHIYSDQMPDMKIDLYHRRILDMQKTLADKVLARSIKENKERYSSDRLRIVNPFSWCCHPSHDSWDISDLYTELELTCSTSSHQRVGSVSTYKLLTLITPSMKILVVVGVGGSGKTSLCKFLIQCWRNQSDKMEGLVHFDLLIFIPCRHVQSETLVNFLAQEELQETFKDVADEDVFRSLYDARLLFIVDGYDEAGPRARSIVQEALHKFPSSAFIITTRPEFQMNVEKVIFYSVGTHKAQQLLYLRGFQSTRRQEYVINLFRKLGENPDAFLEHLKSLDKCMGSFTQLPLTLALMIGMWIDDARMLVDTTSVTEVYRQIINFFLKHMAKRQYERPTETRHIKDIERYFRKWLKTLAKIAWGNLKLEKGGKMSLHDKDEEMLRDKSDDYGLDPTNSLSGLLRCENLTTQFGNHESWEFIHKTIQEFLAAEHLSEEIILTNMSVDDTLQLPSDRSNREQKVKENYQVLIFFAGLLMEKEEMTKLRAQQLLDLVHLQSPWAFSCIYNLSRECKSSQNFQLVLKSLFTEALLRNSLEGFDPESLHCVLQATSLQIPEKLTIEITSSDSDKMKPLLDLLATRGCQTQVIVPVDSSEDASSVIQELQDVDAVGANIIFLCRRSDSFPTLLRLWSRHKPFCIQFYPAVFPLLLLEFVACLLLCHSKPPSRITYTGNKKANEETVKKLTHAIGTHFGHHCDQGTEFVVFEYNVDDTGL